MSKTNNVIIFIFCLFYAFSHSACKGPDSSVVTNLETYGELTTVSSNETFRALKRMQLMRRKSILRRLEERFERVKKEFRISAKKHKTSFKRICSKLKRSSKAVHRLEKKVSRLLEKERYAQLKAGITQKSAERDNITLNLRNILKDLNDYDMNLERDNEDLFYFEETSSEENDAGEEISLERDIFYKVSDHYSSLASSHASSDTSRHASYAASTSTEFEVDTLSRKLRKDMVSLRKKMKAKSKRYATEIKRLRKRVSELIQKIFRKNKDTIKSERLLDEYLITGKYGVTVMSVNVDSKDNFHYILRGGQWSQCAGKVLMPEMRFKKPKCKKTAATLSKKPLCVFNYIIKSAKDKHFLCLLLTSFKHPNSSIDECPESSTTTVDAKIAECGSETIIRFYYFPKKHMPAGEAVQCPDEDYSCKMKVTALVTEKTTVIMGGGMETNSRMQ